MPTTNTAIIQRKKLDIQFCNKQTTATTVDIINALDKAINLTKDFILILL